MTLSPLLVKANSLKYFKHFSYSDVKIFMKLNNKHKFSHSIF